MANITLNIEGDVNIFLNGEEGEPERLFLDGIDGMRDTVEIVLGVKPDSKERNVSVLYACPGERPVPMMLYDAMRLALENGGLDSAGLLSECGLLIAFNEDDVIISNDGGFFLSGPGIIFAVKDGNVIPVDAAKQAYAEEALEKGTAEITNGREIRHAYEL